MLLLESFLRDDQSSELSQRYQKHPLALCYVILYSKAVVVVVVAGDVAAFDSFI